MTVPIVGNCKSKKQGNRRSEKKLPATTVILDQKTGTSSEPLFKPQGWIQFVDRWNCVVGVLVFNVMNVISPYICDVLEFNTINAVFKFDKLTERNDLHHPLVQSKFSKTTFHYTAMLVWVITPNEIRTSKTIKQFHSRYTNYPLYKH